MVFSYLLFYCCFSDSLFNFWCFNYYVSCVDLLGFILFGAFFASRDLMSISFPRLGKFSAVIFSSKFYAPSILLFSFWEPYINIINFYIVRDSLTYPFYNSVQIAYFHHPFRSLTQSAYVYIICCIFSALIGSFKKYFLSLCWRFHWVYLLLIPVSILYGHYFELFIRYTDHFHFA